MLAGPMILMYQVGIGLIWLVNRGKKQPHRMGTAAKEADSFAAITDPPSVQTAATPKVAGSAAFGRRKSAAKIAALFEQDATIQAERAAKLADAKTIWHEASEIAERPIASVAAIADHQPPKIVAAELASRAVAVEAPAPPAPNPTITPVPARQMAAVPIPVRVVRTRRFDEGFSRNRSHHIPIRHL
jgi:hypothetical protein